MPRALPSRSRPAATPDRQPPFRAWKAAAVKVLARVNKDAVTAMERAWDGYYIRGLSPENAATQAACDYPGRHSPDWAVRARW